MTFLATSFVAILAYLDPGSGSFLLQLAIATIVGLAVVLRTQWAKIKKLFGGKSQTSEDEDSDDEQP
jgi:hypothetical protein